MRFLNKIKKAIGEVVSVNEVYFLKIIIRFSKKPRIPLKLLQYTLVMVRFKSSSRLLSAKVAMSGID